MYIVAIAWIYVALMAAAGAESIVGGILTFLGFTLPLALVMWLAGSGARRRKRMALEAQETTVTPPDAHPPAR